MALYRFHVQKISGYFEGCEFHHIPRAENDAADTLSKLGSTLQSIPPGLASEHLRKPSIIPSPESESIYIPANPGSEATPMEIDWGNTSTNPGTIQLDPTGVMSVDVMKVKEELFPVRDIPTWAKPIFEFLKDGTLPSDE